MINWVEWFKVQLHKEMIVVQRKAGKAVNNLIGPTLTLVAKHYVASKYTKEDEQKPIVFLQHPKTARKQTL